MVEQCMFLMVFLFRRNTIDWFCNNRH